jgi:hypothetical protein
MSSVNNIRPRPLIGALLLSWLVSLHYFISTGIWFLTLLFAYRQRFASHPFSAVLAEEFTGYAPAVLLLISSAICYVLACKRRLCVHRLLVIILIGSGVFFGVDVWFQRCQKTVDIATTEYWDSGGASQVYFTWWWYNDQSFKRLERRFFPGKFHDHRQGISPSSATTPSSPG